MALGLDAARNEAHTNRRDGVISREDSRVAVYFIPTDEELLYRARRGARGARRAPEVLTKCRVRSAE